MLQYWFDGPPVDFQIKPHGNSKRATPFFALPNQLGKGIVKLQLSIHQQKQYNLQLKKVAENWRQLDYRSYHETLIRLKTTGGLGISKITMFYIALCCNVSHLKVQLMLL